MRVIITVGTYYPLIDGVQKVTEYLAEGLATKGHEVVVVTRRLDNLAEFEKFKNVEIFRVNIDTIHAIHIGDVDGYRTLIKKLCNDADVLVTVCTQIATTDTLYPIMNEIKCKKILFMHGMYHFEWAKRNIDSLANLGHKIWNNTRWRLLYTKRNFFKGYDRIVQIHRFDGAYDFVYKKYGVKSDILENAVDDMFFNKTDGDVKITGRYAVNVSNYLKGKRQIDTVISFYKADIKDLSLVLIGGNKNDYYQKIEEVIADCENIYGHKDVQLLTGIDRERIALYVQKAEMFLLNSEFEVFPVCLCEAMAAGTPFISTNVGVARFMPGGAVVSNIEEMVYWIRLLAGNDTVRKEMGLAGYEYAVKHFKIENKVLQLEKLLMETAVTRGFSYE